MANDGRTRDELYEEAVASSRGALARLARAYEPDPDKRRDLLQEIHVALWLSLEHFEERCSLSTWVYRVAHNTATSVVTRRKAKAPTLVGLEEVHEALQQIILLYLEGVDAASIGEITGLSPGNVATKIHRIKNLLSRHFHQGHHRGQ